jgi:hypothetical protein
MSAQELGAIASSIVWQGLSFPPVSWLISDSGDAAQLYGSSSSIAFSQQNEVTLLKLLLALYLQPTKNQSRTVDRSLGSHSKITALTLILGMDEEPMGSKENCSGGGIPATT